MRWRLSIGRRRDGTAPTVEPPRHAGPPRAGPPLTRIEPAPVKRGRHVLPVVIAGLVGFVASAVALHWATNGGSVVLNLDLTYSSDACCTTAVWVNDLSKGPVATLPILPGQRHTYGVSLDVSHLSRLRIDFGSVPQSTLTVHGVWLTSDGRVQDRLPLGEIQRFVLYRASSRVVPGGVEYRALTEQPSIDQFFSLWSDVGSVRLFFAKIASKPLDHLVAALLMGAVAAAVLGVATRRDLLLAVTVAGTLFVGRGLHYLSWRHPLDASVDQAVGLSTFVGMPKAREQLMLALAVLAAISVPLLLTAVDMGARRLLAGRGKGLSGAEPPPDGELEPATRRSNRAVLLPAGIVALVALLFVPDLRHTLAVARTQVHPADWDMNNLLFWDYLVHRGLAPVKDFFYPYGFQYLFSIDAPWGDVISYLSYLAFWVYVLVGAYYALARLSGGRALAVRFGTIAAFVCLAAVGGQLPQTPRYIGALGVVLLFAAVGPRDGASCWRRLLFAVAFAHLALFEVVQALYALVPIVFLALVELSTAARRRLVAARAIATVAAPAALVAIILAATGLLAGTAALYAEVRAEMAGWGAPSMIDLWMSHPADLAGFVFWGPPLAVALGIHGLASRRMPGRAAYALVTALGLLGFMVLQKQIVRSGIASAIWLPAVAGLLFWAVVVHPLGRIRHWAMLSALFGALAGLFLAAGTLGSGLETLARGPERLAHSIAALATDRDAFAAAAATRFAPERFLNHTADRELAEALRAEPALSEGGRLWILGDNPVTTILLKERWPYYFTTFYETSPVDWQRKLVRQLDREPPAVVAWNATATAFDGVPNVVRVPLVFDWAITHLVPTRTVGPFEILRPRGASEPVAFAWWRSRLGENVDLGHVPSYTELGDEPCSSGPDCRSYLVIDFGGAPPAQGVVVPIDVGGLLFTITFATDSDVSRYMIDLHRVWFWHNAPAAAGRRVDLSSVGGARITVVQRRRSVDALY